MERLAIFVNDASYAQPLLEPLLAGPEAVASTIVLCPPRLSHRVGKWLSNRQRQQWQRTWSDKVRRELVAGLPGADGARLEWIVAGARLADTTARLRRQLGARVRLLDIRRPTLGHELPALDADRMVRTDERWKAPVAVTSSLSAVLALVD